MDGVNWKPGVLLSNTRNQILYSKLPRRCEKANLSNAEREELILFILQSFKKHRSRESLGSGTSRKDDPIQRVESC